MELVFAAVLGGIALWALWGIMQTVRVSGSAAAAFAVIAVSAVVQILNITGVFGDTYSLVLSIVTTIGMIAGYFIAMRRPARV